METYSKHKKQTLHIIQFCNSDILSGIRGLTDTTYLIYLLCNFKTIHSKQCVLINFVIKWVCEPSGISFYVIALCLSGTKKEII